MIGSLRGRATTGFTGALVASLLLACGGRPAPAAPTPTERPTLIVQIVIDQLRADYADRYGAHWTGGLRRLMAEGATFTDARYPYSGTVTCAGHASIGTGRTPSVHGMVLNEWWDADTRRRVTCTAAPAATAIGFTRATTTAHGPSWLMAPTFAERLRASQPEGVGRVAAFSLKARSAIGLAGPRADAVAWFDDRGTFATSSVYPPPAWLEAFAKDHPIERWRDAVWTRTLPVSSYLGTDDDPGARPPEGWTTRFPHPLMTGEAGDAAFIDHWERSPYSDEAFVDMAMAAVDAMSLGRGRGIDYLGVSFSGLDLVGHKFGPSSHEVQDHLVRLDAAIGRLLAHLDRTVGAERYVVALTGDHGVGEIPERAGGGRIARGALSRIVDETLDTAWGPGDYAGDEVYTDLFLTREGRTRLAGDPAALAKVKAALLAVPGVVRVLSAAEAARGADSPDPLVRAAALSYYPGRSGDLIALLAPEFTSTTDAASHGTFNDYDRRVPVILFGRPFKTGTFESPASPLDIAAVWSRLVGLPTDRRAGSLDAAFK